MAAGTRQGMRSMRKQVRQVEKQMEKLAAGLPALREEAAA
eukprot:CAMPEP_0182909164 /NCGR_PEP_ID=MMETSP0034_2-20130328/35603_1 /TAXON_ID=156128 /ORGANISM="Nephroselmis pyriformis, Strain CCMP717" /LENGTH=39 /DNA_ID= /DNA_START= /DNA_END= /DNA_ORIENTATION=